MAFTAFFVEALTCLARGLGFAMSVIVVGFCFRVERTGVDAGSGLRVALVDYHGVVLVVLKRCLFVGRGCESFPC